MKYIRTKDGHIAKVTRYYEEDGIYTIEIKGKPYFSVFEENVLKQADTIEELCDCYVVWLKNREIPIIEKPRKGYRFYPSYFELGDCSFDKGYGAIWTEWGLKYVAKMNDKGELELL